MYKLTILSNGNEATNLSRIGTSISWSLMRTFNLILSGSGTGAAGTGAAGGFVTVVEVTLWPTDSDLFFRSTMLHELFSLACFLRCSAAPEVGNSLEELAAISSFSIIVLSGDALSLSKISSAKERSTDVRRSQSLTRDASDICPLDVGCCLFRFFSIRMLTSFNKLSISGRFRLKPPRTSSINQSSPTSSDSVIRAGKLQDEEVETGSATGSVLLDDPRRPAI